VRGGIPICWPWFGAHQTNPVSPVPRTGRYSVSNHWRTAQPVSPSPQNHRPAMSRCGHRKPAFITR
jgi:D-hexose-6-phosphate mutarotase